MGKYLNNSDIVMRTGKLAFYKCRGESFYRRMEGFTELTNSKGTKEYTRQYVDEDFERTDVSGYSPEKSYSFDRYKNNEVLDDIIYITENELIGQAMVREILVLDMTTAATGGGNTGGGNTEYASAEGKLRKWAVVPDTDGDTTDCMTYSGTFKCRGEMTDVIATSNDDWQTVEYVVESTESQIPHMDIVITDDNDKTIGTLSTRSSTENLSCDSTTDAFTIKAGATITGASLTLLSNGSTVIASGANTLDCTTYIKTVGTSMKYTLLCAFRSNTSVANIIVNRVSSDSTQATSLSDEED